MEKIYTYRYDSYMPEWYDCHFSDMYSSLINTCQKSISYLFEYYGFDMFLSKRLVEFLDNKYPDYVTFIEYNMYGHDSCFDYPYRYLDKQFLFMNYTHNRMVKYSQFINNL